jgi:hypothetical protein
MPTDHDAVFQFQDRMMPLRRLKHCGHHVGLSGRLENTGGSHDVDCHDQ